MTVHCLTSGCASSFVLNKIKLRKIDPLRHAGRSQPRQRRGFQLDQDALSNEVRSIELCKTLWQGGKLVSTFAKP